MLSSSRSCLRPDPRTGGHEQSRRRILPISILPHHTKFLRCTLGAKRINIGLFPSALHSHPISSSERMAVRHRYVVLAHMKELGLRLNAREVCFSSTENHLSGRGVGSGHDAGTYVPYSDCVNPHVSQEIKRRQFSKTAGSDVSCVQSDTFWPAVLETPTVVAQDQEVLPKGKPTLHDQNHEAMPMCLRHVEEILIFCLRAWYWELLFAE